MDNDPNQTTPREQPDISEVDARIAAEQYVLNQQPSYGFETSPGYAYNESMFDRIVSAIAANKLVLIPLIAIPIIILGSVMGMSMANNSNKTNTNTAEFVPGEDGLKNTIETVSVNSTDEAEGTNTVTSPTESEESTETSNTGSSGTAETSTGSNNGTDTESPGRATPTIPNDSEGFDLCRNLSGIQGDVPSGYTRDINGNCNEPSQPSNPNPNPTPTNPAPSPPKTTPTDLCKNLDGNQTTVPSGRVRDSKGNCNIPPQKITKVLIFIEENTSYRQVNRSQWPYAYTLTQSYAVATRYSFLAGDSLPNYIAMAAGTTAGTSNDTKPGALAQQTVFKQMITAGKTAKTYAQSMSGNCSSKGTSGYHFKHVPWLFFKNEKALCSKFNVPWATNFNRDVAAGNLPNFGMVIPDNDYNSHDGSSRAADRWFRDRMTTIFAGPDWKAGRLAVIFVFDEPKKDTRDNIYMSVIHPSTKGKGAVTTPLNHYSITKLGAELSDRPPLAKGASANSIAKAFGLNL